MREPSQILDDITHKHHGGSVTISTWSWAVHRYTMGFLLMLLVGACLVVLNNVMKVLPRMTAAEMKINELEEDHKTQAAVYAKSVTDLRNDMRGLKSDMDYIKGKLEAMRP